jgi:murein hydrolase activator
VTRGGALLLSLMLAAVPAAAQKYRRITAPVVPTPRPVPAVLQAPEPVIDLSHALPGKSLASLPSSAQQLKSLATELQQVRPQLASAKEKSDVLAAEAAVLRRKLVATAARIENLERRKVEADAQIARLTAEDATLSAGFANDRVAVTRLVGILERLQHDMPPALAMRPDDALGAVRGSMLVGASLPPIYAQAARLSRRIDALKRTRIALEQQQTQAADATARLNIARGELDELLAQKQKEATAAAQSYGTLKGEMERVARAAADFQALLARVKALREKAGQAADGSPNQSVVTVTAENTGSLGGLGRNSLLEPVVGTPENGSSGLSYATRPGAQVIAPADGKVLYAGPYHKSGLVLILEITTGYDIVLAGLGRVTVKPNDQLLAGEPVGTMPAEPVDDRLYFEVRHGGRGQSPAPWLKWNTRSALGKANGT